MGSGGSEAAEDVRYKECLQRFTSCGGKAAQSDDSTIQTDAPHTFAGYLVVYLTADVSAQGVLSAYEALEPPEDGTIGIKLSETPPDGFSWPDLTEGLVQTSAAFLIENSGTDISGYDSVLVLTHFDAGVFSPQMAMYRPMVVEALYRAAGSPAVGTAASFPDVPEGRYTAPTAWAAEQGLMSGCTNDNFGLDDGCNRRHDRKLYCDNGGYQMNRTCFAEKNNQDWYRGQASPAFSSALVWRPPCCRVNTNRAFLPCPEN